jgi:GR25 family glycosyltransferase involved in LPS biosynthesis
LFEDDVEFASGWEKRLARTLTELEAIHGDNFLLSLYCAYMLPLPAYERGELYARYPLEVFAGTQGIYFPARIRSGFSSHLKKHGVDSFRLGYDMILREYLEENNITAYVTAPSLVQHKGLITTGLCEIRHYSPVFFEEVE